MAAVAAENQSESAIAEEATDQETPKLNRPLVWIDLEMTGLNVATDRIIEFAVVVTDVDLEQIRPGPNGAISTPKEVLDQMDEWCTNTHGKSGLTQMCIDSKLTLAEAEQQILDFIVPFAEPKQMKLAGSSVHCDRKFLEKYMPKVIDYLHYGIVDASSIRHVTWYWIGDRLYEPPKSEKHRAMEDIMESICGLKWIKKQVFDVVKDDLLNKESDEAASKKTRLEH